MSCARKRKLTRVFSFHGSTFRRHFELRHTFVAKNILPRASLFVGVGRFKLYYSASCFAVCWKVQALLFCIVLRCLLEGSSFIAVWSASYFVMLLKNFVGVIYQSLRKVCATSGPCTSTRTCFVLNGSRCLIELTRCGRKSNQPSSVQIKNVFYCRLSFTMFCSC